MLHAVFHRLARSPGTFLFVMAMALSPLRAPAAELGEPVLRSYAGQPLVADIELTSLSDPNATVQVRLAHPDVFTGANIAMHPILSNLSLSVMKRDGRQFLHITSVKPLDAEYVHLFLDLGEGGKHNVRAATLWLAPDPAPRPAPVPVAPAPVPVAPAPVPVATPKPLAPAPLRLGAAPPPACPAPKFSADQIKACTALDYKNGLLNAQIVELEEKVRLLQIAIDARPAPPAAPAKVAAAAAPPPKRVAAKASASASAHADSGEGEHEAAGFPWLLVAAAVTALGAVAGAVYVILRRKKARAAAPAAAPAPPAAPGKLAALLARFKRKPKSPAPG